MNDFSADPLKAGIDPGVLGELDAAVQAFVDSGSVPGAVVLIARGGEVAHLSAYGRMGVDRPEPMRTDAVFRIYSMTKPVTTAVALMLCEEGAFAFDDPIANWLPELQHLRLINGSLMDRDITVRDLLCHTAGFTNTFARDALAAEYRKEKVGEGNLDELVAILGRLPLLHQPGERFHYSLATDVLGKLIEIWTGTTLDKVFATRLFAPLGMTDTGFSVRDEAIDDGRFTTNHMCRMNGNVLVADSAATSPYRNAPERLSGGSGLVSTAADYLKFAQMLLNRGGGLLRNETVALMTANQLPDSALPVGVLHPLPGLGFGMGLSVRVSEDAATDPGARAGECGWGGAAGTHFWMLPDEEFLMMTFRQTMPYETALENVLKPIAYRAIK
ncbi:MAG: CubicO group peptidase (beta-lactamase class C family) [Verrucomicrobiales bacterium]|jgi:CubicO group peptidase (beta-lactamase class C family)